MSASRDATRSFEGVSNSVQNASMPSILHFAADRSAIAFGESVTLSWDVAGADTVLLRYPGGEEQLADGGVLDDEAEVTSVDQRW